MYPGIGISTLSLSLYWISILVQHAHTVPHVHMGLIPPDTPDVISKNASSLIELTSPIEYNSDGINVTKCYCEAANLGAAEANQPETVEWGHYYKVDYTNVHLGRIYSLSWSCTSPNLNKHDVPVCWDTKHREGQAQKFPDGNLFAYRVGTYERIFDNGAGGVLSDGRNDRYYFNKQKRGLPKGLKIVDPLPNVCIKGCNGLGGGMVVATDAVGNKSEYHRLWQSRWGDRVHIRSVTTSYPEADDMCEGCK